MGIIPGIFWLSSLQRWFYCNRSLACGRVFETYCDRMGVNLGAVKFLYKGERIFGADTPAALQVGPSKLCTALQRYRHTLLSS